MRVAVVGSGPSGMYATDALVEAGAHVDVFDRLPVPFGLVRYGVAPDHVSIRSVRDTLNQIWEKPGVRFLGNVNVGVDISVNELRSHYDAVILTYGASSDRRLGIAGEDLPGSVAATDFVAWYTGHPEYQGPDFAAMLPEVRRVAVIGVGNVAVDVVRVLSKSADELSATDMPRAVLDVLASAPIEQVILLGRRGPAQGSFTTKELKELGELSEADIRVRGEDLQLDPVSASEVESNKVAGRNVKVIAEWAGREPRADAVRHIDVRFFSRPIRLTGTDSVEGIEIERTELDESGSVIGTGESEILPVDMVVRSVGYRGTPMPGVPFDSRNNVIPNEDGRVIDDSAPLPGLYVAGWIKRGPTGIIGTNKKCAVGTVAALLEDFDSGILTPTPEPDGAIDDLLADRGVEVVSIAGWHAVDAAERALGAAENRDRVTIEDRSQLLRVATA